MDQQHRKPGRPLTGSARKVLTAFNLDKEDIERVKWLVDNDPDPDMSGSRLVRRLIRECYEDRRGPVQPEQN